MVELLIVTLAAAVVFAAACLLGHFYVALGAGLVAGFGLLELIATVIATAQREDR